VPFTPTLLIENGRTTPLSSVRTPSANTAPRSWSNRGRAVQCPSTTGFCTSKHPWGCCASCDVYKRLDNRILRANRQIYDEAHPLLLSSPKLYIVCNGLCLERLFLNIKFQDRRWVQHLRVNFVYWQINSREPEWPARPRPVANCRGMVRFLRAKCLKVSRCEVSVEREAGRRDSRGQTTGEERYGSTLP